MPTKIKAVKNTPIATLGEGSIWHPTEDVLCWIVSNKVEKIIYT